MFTESPLNIILSKWATLISYVDILESNTTDRQRQVALTAALKLVCRDITELVDERYATVHLAATTTHPKRTKVKKWRKLLAKSDHYVGDGRRTCRRIGRALEQVVPRDWHAEANLVEIYDHLVNRLEGQNFEPLESADLPKTLRRFCKTACSLADKLAKSDSVTSRAHRTAGLVARKAVSITLIIGGLVGFEQDIEPAAKDAVEFVTVIMRGLERLIHDDEFVLPLPSRDIRPPQLDLAVIALDLDVPGAVDDNGPEPDGPISSEGVDPEFDGPPDGDGLSVLDLVNDLGQLDLVSCAGNSFAISGE
jgi:hypothetical protein